MKLPKLVAQEINKKYTVSFGGINKTDNYRDGELTDCKNLSSAAFPSLCSARIGKLIWEEAELTDVFWHKNGYLSIVNNVLSFTRYAKKNKITLTQEGWYETFTVKTTGVNENDGLWIRINEKIPKKSVSSFTGISVSFDKGTTLYSVADARYSDYVESSKYYFVELKIADLQRDEVEAGDIIYTHTSESEYITVSESISGETTRTLAVNELLSKESIEKLTEIKLSLKFAKPSDGILLKLQEIRCVGGMTENGKTYITFDRDIYRVERGARLMAYENQPLENDYTYRTLIDNEPTGMVFSDEEYVLYKDTFAKEETDPKTGETLVDSILLPDNKKQICVVGDKICIFPDKILYDADNMTFNYMEEKRICPNETWEFGTDYFKCSEGSFFDYDFEPGDEVLFSFLGDEHGEQVPEAIKSNCIYAVIKSVTSGYLYFNSNTFASYSSGGIHKCGDIMITRKVPSLDFVCARGGRLYGTEGNRIHVSKYGSPRNFKFFQGGAMDSYYIDVSSSGKFTGCIPYSSYVLFFKENEIIKLYGEKPSDYQISSTACPGVAPSSERSLFEADGCVFYLGADGVYNYSGGYPTKISTALGNERLRSGVGGGNNRSYYLSATDGQGLRKNYVYDLQNRIWLSEDVGDVNRFLFFNSEAAYLNSSGLNLTGGGDCGEFSAEFCTVYENVFEKKKYQRFYLRSEVPEGASFRVEMSLDGGDYYEIKEVSPMRSQLVTVPLAPNRCDSFSVRISGRGAIKILSLMREFYMGGDTL